MDFRRIGTTGALVVCLATAASAAVCPAPGTVEGLPGLVFDANVVALATVLKVNPDGAAASYTAGDHGFTYIVNGVDLIRDGKTVSCQQIPGECRAKFLDAERRQFGPGTAEFCAYAIEADAGAGAPQPCPARDGARIGNGKGKPRVAATLQTIGGEGSAAYRSMTALRQATSAGPAYIDSSRVPGLVGPSREWLGRLAWVRVRGTPQREALAVFTDVGPRLGEGSIALHQLLREGALWDQAPGPIPVALRCTDAEAQLKPPFVSRPDAGSADRCRPGHVATTAADVRAYQGLGAVDMVLLRDVRLPMARGVVQVELTPDALRTAFEASGHTVDEMRERADCLRSR